MRRLGAVLVGALFGAASLPSAGNHEAAARQRIDRALQGWPVAEFTLADQRGSPIKREHLLDHWTFVVFGHASCGEQCAPALDAMRTVTTRIARTKAMSNTRVLFVSLDPQADTPARLAAFLGAYHAQWIGATGPGGVPAALADELGAEGKGPGGSIVLVGPDGNVRAAYLPPYDPLVVTSDYMRARPRAGTAAK